ncbi:MAG: formyltransferase family protein [Egibacteraceae bacterium]
MGAAALAALLGHLRPRAVLTPGPGPVADLARAHGLPVEAVAGPGQGPLEARVARHGPLDVVVVGCWAERIGRAALAVPAHGWWNLHPSALPAWRGADPVTWQLLAGAREVGCSVHEMTPGLDDGPVLARGAVAVGEDDDRGAVLARAGARLGALAGERLTALAAGEHLAGQAQDEAAATSCPPAGTAVLLDPARLRAAEAARLLRAVSPAPGAAVTGLAASARCGHPRIGPRRDDGEAAGGVVDLDEGRVALACRDRWVRAARLDVGAVEPGPSRTLLAFGEPPAGGQTAR